MNWNDTAGGGERGDVLAAIAPPVVVRKEDAASVRGGGGSTRAGRAGWAGDSSLQCLRCAVIAGCRRARQGVLVVGGLAALRGGVRLSPGLWWRHVCQLSGFPACWEVGKSVCWRVGG